MSEKRQCHDHIGNEFKSVIDMCYHYNIAYVTFRKRIKSGMTLEEALTTPVMHRNRSKKPKDHLGNEYESTDALCKHYGINTMTLKSRREKGWTLEEALTIPLGDNRRLKDGGRGRKIPRTDHLGNNFKSTKEMCETYGISTNIFYKRMRLGWSLEDVLTKGDIKDHLGNEYKSVRDMCNQYNIPYWLFYKRKELGWSLEDILTTKYSKTEAKEEDIIQKFKRSAPNELVKVFGSTKNTNFCIYNRVITRNCDIVASMLCSDRMRISHISLDGRAYYKVSGEVLSTRDIVLKYRPDIINIYDTWNPKDLYTVNRGEI